ncbi:MAG: hypothetical protein F2793_10055 [Actinobacteria bacterium]|uniref:Unannotated protein n=1 Tax=freshwater metagenome TaxID=449393 RepID=A0A6J7F3T2_9ZZZZ|nr:hypothetical protein [Actinomycetota bacterium]
MTPALRLDAEAVSRFAAFRGESSKLGEQIRALEEALVGALGVEAAGRAAALGVDDSLLAGAVSVKALSAQIDVVLHAVGIIEALPHILAPGEQVQALSLGAGNTNRDFDLETDLQVAEFKFIGWRGGAESVRQDAVLIDVFNLDRAKTERRKVLYLTGSSIPLRYLSTSKRKTRACLARRPGVLEQFDAIYGADAFIHVADYWAAVRDRIEVVDLVDVLPVLGVATGMGEQE